MGNFPEENLKLEIVEGADRDWNGYYDKISCVTDKWLSQQPRSEEPPQPQSQSPSESASTVTVDKDQTPSVPVISRTIRGPGRRFSGQVL